MSRVEVETEGPGGRPAADAPVDESEAAVSMAEVYERMQADALQAQALASRSGAKLERCSYSDGAHTQAVYRCRTCHPAGDVGVCLGCAMGCHLEHDVEELFERRAFTCDCGNAKAGGSCQLQTEKAESNPGNVYNQNFRGTYCHCHGSYDAEKDVMVCCVLCQDWFHDRCLLGATLPEEDETRPWDFLCSDCLAASKHSVLLPYFDWAERERQRVEQLQAQAPHSAPSTPGMSRSNSLTPMRRQSSSFLGASPAAAASPASAAAAAAAPVPPAFAAADSAPVSESKESASDDAVLTTPTRKRKADELATPAEASPAPLTPATPAAANSSACQRPIVVAALAEAAATATDDASAASAAAPAATAPPPVPVRDRFVPSDWNQFLCACPSCTEEYRTHGLLFLLDEEEPAPAAGAAAADGAPSASVVPASSSGSDSVLARMSDAESSAPVSGAFDPESMGAALVERLPRSVAVDVLTPFAQFQAAILKGLNDFAQRCPGVVVTKDIMQNIARQAKLDTDEAVRESKRQRLAGLEQLPE